MTHSSSLNDMPVELLEKLMIDLSFSDCLSILLSTKALYAFLQREELLTFFYRKCMHQNLGQFKNDAILANHERAISTLKEQKIFNETTCQLMSRNVHVIDDIVNLITTLNIFGLATKENCRLFIGQSYGYWSDFLKDIQSITIDNKKHVQALLKAVELKFFPFVSRRYDRKILVTLYDAELLTLRNWNFLEKFSPHKKYTQEILDCFVELNQQKLLDTFFNMYLDEKNTNSISNRVGDVKTFARILIALNKINCLGEEMINALLSIELGRYKYFDAICILENNHIFNKTTLTILFEKRNLTAFNHNIYDVAHYLDKLNRCGWFNQVNDNNLLISTCNRILTLLESLLQFPNFSCDYFFKKILTHYKTSEKIFSAFEQLIHNHLLTHVNYQVLIEEIRYNHDDYIDSFVQVAIRYPEIFSVVNDRRAGVSMICHAVLRLKEADVPLTLDLMAYLQRYRYELPSTVPILLLLKKHDLLNDESLWVFDYGKNVIEVVSALIELKRVNFLNAASIKFLRMCIPADYCNKMSNIAWTMFTLSHEGLLEKLPIADIVMFGEMKCRQSTFASKLVCFLHKQILYLTDSKKHFSAFFMRETKVDEKINEYRKVIKDITNAATEVEIMNIAANLRFDSKLTQSCNLLGFSFYNSPSTIQLNQYVETQVKPFFS